MKRPGKRHPPFCVQVIVGGDLEYFRNTLLGARHYGFDSGRLVFADRWLAHEMAGDWRGLVRRDKIDGIIAAVNSSADAGRLTDLGVPVVNVSNSKDDVRVPLVTQDDEAAGRLAAEHLRACGCRNFGFWGQPQASYSEQRLAGFRAGLAAAGVDVERDLHVGMGLGEGKRRDATRLFERMKLWLARQHSPLGVFAVLDTSALQLMRAARDLGRRIPEDVALLGAGDDDFWVDFESVPLSSVRLPSREIGYEAARLLERLISRGERGLGEIVRLPVSEVVARRSTDVLFVDDPAVARAVRLIREGGGRQSVGELVRVAGVSRSGLQARFKAALGRSMLAEIHRVKLARARELLETTDMKLAEVAEQSGMGSAHRLSVLFRAKLGRTPSAFRGERRSGNGG